MELYWIFLIIAVVAAINADKIGSAAKKSGTLKKLLGIACAVFGIASICMIIISMNVIA